MKTMNREQQEYEMREIAIEAWNIIFGRALFTYISLPTPWVTGYQINDPVVTNRILYRNLMWVGVGETECLISREGGEQKRPILDFKLKVTVDLQREGPVAPSSETLQKHHEKKGHQIIKQGELQAGGHTGRFVVWKSHRPRFYIFGSPRLIARIEGYIPCDETNRLLTLTWTSPSSNLILKHSDTLIACLNSILCHGHDLAPDEAIFF